MINMIKKVSAGFGLFITANVATALPVYYNFDVTLGTHSFGAEEQAILGPYGISPDSSFRMTVLIDEDRFSELHRPSSDRIIERDHSDEVYAEVFYVAPLEDANFFEQDTQYFLGATLDSDIEIRTSGRNGKYGDRFVFDDFSDGLNVGSIAELMYDPTFSTRTFGSATLVNISDIFDPLASSLPATIETPIPATLPLFASGLAGLLVWRRKKTRAA